MKSVKEISIALENKPGTLSEISELISTGGINILAITARTTGSEGTVSFVASDPSRAISILDSAGHSPIVKDIIAAETPNHPGGFNAILRPLKRKGINIDYLYPCIGGHGAGDSSIILLGVNDLAAAYETLSSEWIKMYGEELYDM
jgi:hypothetical protein